ncbi:MAG: hypothetical protein UT58_C0008G0006 [Microgenomates group bacterium GW2011_GWC1_39_7b]|uniref:Uncharacterized protein n=3 Tax=Candidatus Woeseibacteriota TaxID=1752722 RepID=A0A0G0UY66_9BACT|nr:MAG: hypothetical protein UT17_C0002G0168 [Candidatus Woesebacteria bacterium GW2011_GWB1_39_10]KKR26681.1 MAG: hypothetical protein UT58_C0008G0006 [Microgenomates group bacterium GW2011_GWC1_39_7b]KKR74188.1 MAG: hypothetical protein UU16_C0004G0012 [Candidatus Woesebacteria bacterium GW2011_GWA2_40_7]KKR92481.1 MAG: hypothetical protein UU42_C0001G0085 [Candidatus Woesebacteria bacterium GW2011_GWA1_41_13b]
MTEKEYLTALNTFTMFGPARTKLLLSYFKSAKKIWDLKLSELTEVGVKQETAEKFIKHRDSFNIQDYLSKLEKLSIKVVTIFDDDYPENLKGLSDAPFVLYIRGNFKNTDSNAVAIVGSRMMTSYGREVAKKFAGELASFGVTIVSGLALGVDAEAQRAALSVGGRTISALASGLDIISPYTNKKLALEFISKDGGAVVSENPLGYEPHPYDFPVRDRLISGLSKAVIVVEGRMKSGTFYTVKAAADQGRTVFAVPGPITSPTSEAPNYLIQNGSKLATSTKDILDELHLQFKVDKEAVKKVMPGDVYEEKILKILMTEPLHLDELVRISGGATSEVSARLTIMEMKGMVRNLGQGVFKKA